MVIIQQSKVTDLKVLQSFCEGSIYLGEIFRIASVSEESFIAVLTHGDFVKIESGLIRDLQKNMVLNTDYYLKSDSSQSIIKLSQKVLLLLIQIYDCIMQVNE